MIINTYTLPQLVDLALRVPEIGAINFNILHTVLMTMIDEMKLKTIRPWCNIESPIVAKAALTTMKLKPPTGKKSFSDEVFQLDQEMTPSLEGENTDQDGAKAAKEDQEGKQLQPLAPEFKIPEKTSIGCETLPSNKLIMEGIQQGEPILPEMWRAINVNRRVDAAEEALGRLFDFTGAVVDQLRTLTNKITTQHDKTQEFADEFELQLGVLRSQMDDDFKNEINTLKDEMHSLKNGVDYALKDEIDISKNELNVSKTGSVIKTKKDIPKTKIDAPKTKLDISKTEMDVQTQADISKTVIDVQKTKMGAPKTKTDTSKFDMDKPHISKTQIDKTKVDISKTGMDKLKTKAEISMTEMDVPKTRVYISKSAMDVQTQADVSKTAMDENEQKTKMDAPMTKTDNSKSEMDKPKTKAGISRTEMDESKTKVDLDADVDIYGKIDVNIAKNEIDTFDNEMDTFDNEMDTYDNEVYTTDDEIDVSDSEMYSSINGEGAPKSEMATHKDTQEINVEMLRSELGKFRELRKIPELQIAKIVEQMIMDKKVTAMDHFEQKGHEIGGRVEHSKVEMRAKINQPVVGGKAISVPAELRRSSTKSTVSSSEKMSADNIKKILSRSEEITKSLIDNFSETFSKALTDIWNNIDNLNAIVRDYNEKEIQNTADFKRDCKYATNELHYLRNKLDAFIENQTNRTEILKEQYNNLQHTKADKDEMRNCLDEKMDNVGFSGELQDIRDSIENLMFDLSEQAKDIEDISNDVRADIDTKMDNAEFRKQQDPILNQLKALWNSLKHLRDTILGSLFPEASAITKCLCCGHPAVLAGSKYSVCQDDSLLLHPQRITRCKFKEGKDSFDSDGDDKPDTGPESRNPTSSCEIHTYQEYHSPYEEQSASNSSLASLKSLSSRRNNFPPSDHTKTKNSLVQNHQLCGRKQHDRRIDLEDRFQPSSTRSTPMKNGKLLDGIADNRLKMKNDGNEFIVANFNLPNRRRTGKTICDPKAL